MSNLNFHQTDEFIELAHEAARRAESLIEDPGHDLLDYEMDLVVCNNHACPLDLEKLNGFDDFSFIHDMVGIARHLCHETGQLKNAFRPRCAL